MKNNQGFTLIEVIISIAVLSIISVIFLQLFVKANDIDESSYSLDKSVMISNSALEIVKGIKEVSEIKEVKFFGDFELIEEEDDFYYVAYYDNGFKHCDQEQAMYKHILSFDVLDISAMESAYLYSVTSNVVNIEKDKELMSISSKVVLGK